jgi:Uma2 family endonuclease
MNAITKIEPLCDEWARLCDDPQLDDLPYKIELLLDGSLKMTPHKPRHSLYQDVLSELLKEHLPEGRTAPEVAIITAEGVRVADVVWGSHERWTQLYDTVAAPIAPEICIEVILEERQLRAMIDKAQLYFAAGALEVWICCNGPMTFLPGPSNLAPNFPGYVQF